jgi:ligand-binding sensor domain-containing protein
MKFKIPVIIISIILIPGIVKAQTYKNWKIHLSYYNTTNVEESNEYVYALANGSLYKYGKEDNSITTLSRLNGLNDTDISLIKYNTSTNSLIIVYANGNIDILTNEGAYNIADLKNATNIQGKGVNDITFVNNLVYLSTDFGIIVLNISKKEISEIYMLDVVTNTVFIYNNTIYAATNMGLLSASTKDNLLDKNVWSTKTFNNKDINLSNIRTIGLFNEKPVFFVKEKGIYYTENNEDLIEINNNRSVTGIAFTTNKLLAYTSNELFIFNTLSKDYDYVNLGVVKDVSSLKNDNKYWIASGDNGIVCIQKTSDNQFTKIVSDITINSPKRNYCSFMTTFNDKKLIVAGGGRYTTRYGREGTLMILEDDKWTNLDESVINTEIRKIINSSAWDYMGVAVDPDDENHYFIATYGEGVVEIKDNEFVKLHALDNSTLGSAVQPPSPNYVRTGSVCFDKNKNLWVTNGLVQNSINVLKTDGKWVSLYYQPISGGNSDKIDKILIRSNGHKWVNIPYLPGILVFNDNETIDDTSDDTYNFFSSFRDSQNAAGGSVSPGAFLSMAEDKNGTMWIGTNLGFLKINNPDYAITNASNLSCSRLVRDGKYFLDGESVTALAVDNDNQKWIGTNSSGIFLINEDGSETINNFTTDNSPLLSNTIESLSINNATGTVFIGTNKGIVSYETGIKKGESVYSNVYAYPNPVRPDFTDKVTITGLTNGTNVKITDINGNLIFQAKSTGGQITWNCRSANKERVATGIYLVLASSSNGSESVVTKIAVIK